MSGKRSSGDAVGFREEEEEMPWRQFSTHVTLGNLAAGGSYLGGAGGGGENLGCRSQRHPDRQLGRW